MHETRSNWVFQNVACHSEQIFIGTEYMFVSISLPESFFELFLIVIPGELLCSRDEPPAIRGRVATGGEQVNVIRHLAVGDQIKRFHCGGAQNLRTHQIDSALRHEHAASEIGAERQEVPMFTEIIEGLEGLWMPRNHRLQQGKSRSESG
jgi:hypothetical protein